MRNSSVEFKVVVLTDGWPAVFVVAVFEGLDLEVLGFAFVMDAVEDVVTVVECRVGSIPVAC